VQAIAGFTCFQSESNHVTVFSRDRSNFVLDKYMGRRFLFIKIVFCAGVL